MCYAPATLLRHVQLDRYFGISRNSSNLTTELRAGLVTFLTSSYIRFVQPAVLTQAGMDFGAVMAATCLSAALGCLIMGLWANYPIALAPGMAINFYFTYSVIIGARSCSCFGMKSEYNGLKLIFERMWQWQV